MSDNGGGPKLTIVLSPFEAEVCDLALRKMAAVAEAANEQESWDLAHRLAERFRNAVSVKEWT